MTLIALLRFRKAVALLTEVTRLRLLFLCLLQYRPHPILISGPSPNRITEVLEISPITVEDDGGPEFTPSEYYCIPLKQTPWPLVRKRTIPTDRPPLVGEI
jgi:hypothetical protein